MTRAAEMLDTTPAHVDVDRDALAECIAACVECARTSTAPTSSALLAALVGTCGQRRRR